MTRNKHIVKEVKNQSFYKIKPCHIYILSPILIMLFLFLFCFEQDFMCLAHSHISKSDTQKQPQIYPTFYKRIQTVNKVGSASHHHSDARVSWQLFTSKYIVMCRKLGRLDSCGILTISCLELTTIVAVQQKPLSLVNALQSCYELYEGNSVKRGNETCLLNKYRLMKSLVRNRLSFCQY